MKAETKASIAMTFVGIGCLLVIGLVNYGLALAGHPVSAWFMCDILRLCNG